MIQVLLEKGVEIVALIIANLRRSYTPLKAPMFTHKGVPKSSMAIEETSMEGA